MREEVIVELPLAPETELAKTPSIGIVELRGKEEDILEEERETMSSIAEVKLEREMLEERKNMEGEKAILNMELNEEEGAAQTRGPWRRPWGDGDSLDGRGHRGPEKDGAKKRELSGERRLVKRLKVRDGEGCQEDGYVKKRGKECECQGFFSHF